MNDAATLSVETAPSAVILSRTTRRDVLTASTLLVAWVVAVVIANPRGNFPIIDDWAFVPSLVQLRENGTLVLSDWAAMNFVSQLAWALPFAFIRPPDFETARLSSLVAGGLVGPCLYATLRLVGTPSLLAALFSALFIFNPVLFFMSFTFMTDVFYCLMQALACLFLVLALFRPSVLAMIASWLAGLAALMSRQVAIALPIAFSVAALSTQRLTKTRTLVCLVAIASFVAVQAGFRIILERSGKLPRFYGRQSNDIAAVFHQPLPQTLKLIVDFSVPVFTYLGLFLLPCSIAAVVIALQRRSRATRLAVSGMIVGLTAMSYLGLWGISHNAVPFFGDVLAPWGIRLDLNYPEHSNWYVRLLRAFGSIGGSTLLVCSCFLAADGLRRANMKCLVPRDRMQMTTLVFFAALTLILLAPVFVVTQRFDRYFLPPTLSSLVTLGAGFDFSALNRPLSRVSLAVAAVAASLFLLGSVVFAHDYLGVRRVEWQALNELVASGIKPGRIDAGWVFNGYRSYGKFGDPSSPKGWYEKRDYVIALHSEPGFDVVKTLSVAGWAPWTRTWSVVVLKALEAQSGTP